MKTRVLNICLAVLLIAAGYVWGNHSVVHAQQHTPANVPKAWGHVVGGTAETSLLFEDSDGVIRFVNAYNGNIVLQVNRQ